jgi:LuxR family maltose regulon positive regulatory protein
MFFIEPARDLEMNNQQLILAKLEMPAEGTGIPRPRLFSILEASILNCTSTIICARAGAGKTMLTHDFAQRCGRAIAWYKLDAPDADLGVFLEYLIACIRRCRPGFGTRRLPDLLASNPEPDPTLLAETVVYELLESCAEPLLIVIEDLHRVCDSVWVVPFFGRLLPLLPADVHVLITTRTLPPAPLWRMRSKQTLSVVEDETLNFTRQETFELFTSNGFSREQASIAFDHTRGRAVALASFVTTLQLAERRANRTVNIDTTISS